MSPQSLTPQEEEKFRRQHAISLGWSLPVIVMMCVGGGYYVGRRTGHLKAGIFIGLFFGLVCAAYETWKVVREIQDQDPARPKKLSPDA